MVVVVCAGLAGGCAAEVKAPPAARPGVGAADDAAMATDASAVRLQDISGAMLLYYVKHKELPGVLEDLRPLVGPEMAFANPVTGQPYVYVRSGLAVPGQERMLLLYDAAAGADGWRWGIVASLPDGNRPLTMMVVRLSEKVLNAYLLAVPEGK